MPVCPHGGRPAKMASMVRQTFDRLAGTARLLVLGGLVGMHTGLIAHPWWFFWVGRSLRR